MLICTIKPNGKLVDTVKGAFPVSLLPIAITPLYSFSQSHYDVNDVAVLGEALLKDIIKTLLPFEQKIKSFSDKNDKTSGLSFYLEYLYLDQSTESLDEEKYFSMNVREVMDEDFFLMMKTINENSEAIHGSSNSIIHDYFFSLSDIFTFRETLQKENKVLQKKRFVDMPIEHYEKAYLTEAEHGFSLGKIHR